MKKHTITTLIALGLFPALGLAQTTPAPAAPAPAPATSPAAAAAGAEKEADRPKVQITFLGVETSEVPTVVAEQLGLAKGFGLVVDYVVPDGPAATAGVQQNDILKMFNDQILTEPDQLAKLIRSNAEGTNAVLTVLRKGSETKINVRLGKKEVPQRRNQRWKGFGALDGDFNEQMKEFGEELGKMDFSMFDGVEARRVRDEAQRAQREAQREAREAQREMRNTQREAQREARDAAREASRAAREAARQFRVSRRDNGGLKTTHIDMDRAQIVYHDNDGELKLESVAGKKVLTAKNAQGVTVFSGPVETKEDLDKLPPDVRQRFEKLEQKDLPSLAPVPPVPPVPAVPPVPPVPAVPPVPSGNEVISVPVPDDDEEATDVIQTVSQVSCPSETSASSESSNFDLNIVLI